MSISSDMLSGVADLLRRMEATEGRPVDLVDLDDVTPVVRYLLDSGDLVRVG